MTAHDPAWEELWSAARHVDMLEVAAQLGAKLECVPVDRPHFYPKRITKAQRESGPRWICESCGSRFERAKDGKSRPPRYCGSSCASEGRKKARVKSREVIIAHAGDRPTSPTESIAVGSKLYWPAKPCVNGHFCQRFTANRGCIECLAERKRLYRKLSPDHNRQVQREWRDANKERLRGLETERYHADLAKSREKRRRSEKSRRLKNPDAVRDAARASRHLRRARLRSAEGKHCAADLRRIRKAQRSKCAVCRAALGRHPHIDHIVPLARGGSNWPSNLQWLCASCNGSKKARDPIEFMQSLGRLL